MSNLDVTFEDQSMSFQHRELTETQPDHQRLTRPAKREDALKDFKGYGSNVMELLKLTKPDLDIWAIFDLGNKVPRFNKGNICIVGDA